MELCIICGLPLGKKKSCPRCKEVKENPKDGDCHYSIKENLTSIVTLLGSANKVLNKLPCECDDYNGFECNLHGWRNTLTKIREEINEAVEGEE